MCPICHRISRLRQDTTTTTGEDIILRAESLPINQRLLTHNLQAASLFARSHQINYPADTFTSRTQEAIDDDAAVLITIVNYAIHSQVAINPDHNMFQKLCHCVVAQLLVESAPGQCSVDTYRYAIMLKGSVITPDLLARMHASLTRLLVHIRQPDCLIGRGGQVGPKLLVFAATFYEAHPTIMPPALYIHFLNCAAACGDSDAQFEVARAHAQGLCGIPVNTQLADMWYAQAAKSRHTHALWNLSLSYMVQPTMAMSVTRRRALVRKALAHQIRAIHAGSTVAMYSKAMASQVEPANATLTRVLLTCASVRGHVDATYMLAHICSRLPDTIHHRGLALDLLRRVEDYVGPELKSAWPLHVSFGPPAPNPTNALGLLIQTLQAYAERRMRDAVALALDTIEEDASCIPAHLLMYQFALMTPSTVAQANRQHNKPWMSLVEHIADAQAEIHYTDMHSAELFTSGAIPTAQIRLWDDVIQYYCQHDSALHSIWLVSALWSLYMQSKSAEEVFLLFQKAATDRCPISDFQLGIIHEDWVTGKRVSMANYALDNTSTKALAAAAQSGHVAAMELQGLREMDEDTTLQLWNAAAHLHSAGAMWRLGMLYSRRNDMPTALQWYTRAADIGHPQSKIVVTTSFALPTPKQW
jgi:TPR repeat protein